MLNFFSHFHKQPKLAIIILPYFQFPSLFTNYECDSQNEVDNNGILYCGEFKEKYSTDCPGSIANVEGSPVASFLSPGNIPVVDPGAINTVYLPLCLTLSWRLRAECL